MPLFVCDTCGCVDNTAMPGNNFYEVDDKSQLCTECYNGKWHGEFPKMKAKKFSKKYPKERFIDKRKMEEYFEEE